MLFNLIALALLGLAQGQTVGTETNCNNIQNYPIDYAALAAASPLLLLRTNNPSLNCTTGLLTGPVTSQYYFMLIRQNVVTYSFNVDSTADETQASTLTTCSDKSPFNYKFLQSSLSLNATGSATTNPYFIAYLCDPSGTITLLKGYGRSEASNGAALQAQIKSTLGGIKGAMDSDLVSGWADSNKCSANTNCGGFFN